MFEPFRTSLPIRAAVEKLLARTMKKRNGNSATGIGKSAHARGGSLKKTFQLDTGRASLPIASVQAG